MPSINQNARCVCRHRLLYHDGPCTFLHCACRKFESPVPSFLATGDDNVTGRPFLTTSEDLEGLGSLYHWLCNGATGLITLEYDDCHD